MLSNSKTLNNIQTDQIYVDDGFIVIHVINKIEVPLTDLDTAEKLLRHVYNQSTKTWMTAEILRRFIELASAINNIKFH